MLKKALCICQLILATFLFTKMDVKAVDFPGINVNFDTTDESVIVDGIPAFSSDGTVEYQLEGYLNYETERIDTFCYAPHVRAYDVADKKAYIFNWSGDAEFLLPCTGDYKFTAYITARYQDGQGNMVEESGPKTTISITLHKKDESTNWGPGLPNTTVETYDLNQIKGKDKIITIEEPEYTWSISGTEIETVPDENLSLKITVNPDSFPNTGVEEFFGDSVALKMNIEHNGEFGFRAILDYKIGEEFAGKYANLFYVPGDGTFEYINGSVVDEKGMATFAFTHASDYIFAITDVEYTGQKLYTEIEEPIVEIKAEEAESENLIATEEASAEDEGMEAIPTDEKDVCEEEAITEASSNATQSETTSDGISTWLIVGGIGLFVVIGAIWLIKRKVG